MQDQQEALIRLSADAKIREEKALQAMTQADKYRAFRNFMANELGVGKEDIRVWVRETIQEEVAKLLGQLNVESLIASSITKEVSRLLNQTFLQSTAQEEVRRAIREQLIFTVEHRQKVKETKEINS